MPEPKAAPLIDWSGLPRDGSQPAVWRILDTRFDRGLRFLRSWQAWKNDPRRPRILHYVALTAEPISLNELLAAAPPHPELQALARELATQWFGLLPGFHRLTLDGAQVLLTLCVGDLTALLRQQQFLADAIYLDPAPPDSDEGLAWNIWSVKALARCCRRGSALFCTSSTAGLRADLTQCGFELGSRPTAEPTSASDTAWHGYFNPRWTIKTTRHPTAWSAPATSCAVIGAGLAGASVAAALALRGWQVQVLDQGDAPASGASGLPVGLVVAHASADDCALSRLSRCGVRLMLQQARQRLRRGQDWDDCGTLERRLDGSPGLPSSWPDAGHDWSCDAAPSTPAGAWQRALNQNMPALWHARAAWLKPAELVRAWLKQAGVTFQGQARVASIRQCGEDWELLDGRGRLLARARRVVLANASGVLPLLQTLQTEQPGLGLRLSQLPAMHAVRGQLSWALNSATPPADFPPFPVHGAGSVIPAVPTDGGRAWFVGASYQPASRPPAPDEEAHASNFGRLNKLLPNLGQALAPQFATGAIHAWKNTRWVTSDRLPMVGPLYQGEQPGLWICAGMGSRGLSFSVLCAELLAAHWGGEPLPLEASLALSLIALRGVGSGQS